MLYLFNKMPTVRPGGQIIVSLQTEKEKAEWRAALLPVHKTMEERIGKELINAVNKETAK